MGKVLPLRPRTAAPAAGLARRAGRGGAALGQAADRTPRQAAALARRDPQALDAALRAAARNIAPWGDPGGGQGELDLARIDLPGGRALAPWRAGNAESAPARPTTPRLAGLKLRGGPMDWLRWWHGSTSDPKWRVVAATSGQPISAVLAVWAAVLEHASEATPRGQIAGLDSRVVGAALDLKPAAVDAIRAGMQGFTLTGEEVTAWSKRQRKRERPDDSSAERTAAYRARSAEGAPGPRRMAGAGDRAERKRAWFNSIVEVARTQLEPERFSRWVEAMTTGGPEAEPGGWAWKLAEEFDGVRKAEREARRHG